MTVLAAKIDNLLNSQSLKYASCSKYVLCDNMYFELTCKCVSVVDYSKWQL